MIRKLCKATALLFLAAMAARADMPAGYCGDEGLVCGDTERCCEHVMAYFGDGGATSPPYVEGQCIPKEQRCAEYWCGNRRCHSGFFGMQNVCCVNNDPSHAPQYTCSYSELSCPGNTEQLSIRDKQVALRTLQGN